MRWDSKQLFYYILVQNGSKPLTRPDGDTITHTTRSFSVLKIKYFCTCEFTVDKQRNMAPPPPSNGNPEYAHGYVLDPVNR